MKKEDFTDRLIRRFFGVMGPFDEYRQQVIYRAAARAFVQIVYSNIALFFFYLFLGRYIDLVRDSYPYLIAVIIFGFAFKARRHIALLELENDDESEITYPRFTHKQILRRTWLTFLGVPLACFIYLVLQRSFSDHENIFKIFWNYFSNPISLALFVLYFFVGAMFAGIVYSAMSEHEKKD